MSRPATQPPRTWGRWTCMMCTADGIGGLNAFYVHYAKEHHRPEPEAVT